jgi:PQQ-dependent catabolism-associated CXXCW motif protein
MPMRMCRSIRAAFFSLLALASVALAAGPDVDPVSGYRLERYRAPTPDDAPTGARRISPEGVAHLAADAVLLDVSPVIGAGFDPATGHWRVSAPHLSLPGAVWLPEIGRGVLEPRLERFLGLALVRLTAGDMARPLVIFCQADCWMSWNASLRLARLGHSRVFWFAEGTDGWLDIDRPLAVVQPEPVPVD